MRQFDLPDCVCHRGEIEACWPEYADRFKDEPTVLQACIVLVRCNMIAIHSYTIEEHRKIMKTHVYRLRYKRRGKRARERLFTEDNLSPV